MGVTHGHASLPSQIFHKKRFGQAWVLCINPHKFYAVATFRIKVGGLKGVGDQVDVVVAGASELVREACQQLAPIAAPAVGLGHPQILNINLCIGGIGLERTTERTVVVVEQERKALEFDVDAVGLLVCAMPSRDDGLVGVSECIVDGNVQW